MVRAPYYDKNGLKKGAWSREEDSKLKVYIERYGHWSWRELPKFAGLERCGKSCRLRWMNYLRPNVKRGNFSPEEEETILNLHAELGNKWSIMAAKLPGRTDNEIKNHWHTHLKKRALQDSARFEGRDETSEGKDHSNNASESEGSQMKDFKAENFPDHGALSHTILESCPLSPEASSSDVSSLSFDYVEMPSTNHVTEDPIMHDVFEDVGGDFWTEPFVAETNAYLQNSFWLSFEGGQFELPYVSYYDDPEDLLYQVIQEFPEN